MSSLSYTIIFSNYGGGPALTAPEQRLPICYVRLNWLSELLDQADPSLKACFFGLTFIIEKTGLRILFP